MLTRIRRRLVAWLFADDRQPDWPLRCGSRGCRDAAQPELLPDGSVRILCRDCAVELASSITVRQEQA